MVSNLLVIVFDAVVNQTKVALINGFLGTDLTSFQNFTPFDAQPRNQIDTI